jgi:uncharacterized protein (TIGR02391 family)
MASKGTVISKPVWDAIKDNYEKGSYTTAITNLLIYVQDVVREKSGLELDGTALMDKAFLGDKPILQINKLETKTEKDIQSGIGYILKGLCLAIRNPRSHERYNDDKTTADRIIYFVDYILSFIQNTKYGSLVEDWMDLLFDDEFIGDDEYLNELYNVLPKKNQLDLLINIFRQKEKVKSKNTVKFIKRIIEGLNNNERESLYDSISKELMTYKSDDSLRSFLFVFPPELWNGIEKLPRLQIEGKIKDCFEQGIVIYESSGFEEPSPEFNEPALTAISAIKHIKFFTEKNRSEIIEIIAKHLIFDNYMKRNLVLDHLIGIFDYYDDCINNVNLANGLEKYISNKKKERDDRIIELVHRKIGYENNTKWKNRFEKIYSERILGDTSQDASDTETFTEDIPF